MASENVRYIVTDQSFIGSEFPSTIQKFVNFEAPMTILDVEPHEGLSSCLFSDICAQHPESKIVSIGTFPSTETSPDPEKTFLRNILRSRSPQKVQLYNIEHAEFFRLNQFMYDIVYVRMVEDAEKNRWLLDRAYDVLKNNGMLWIYGYMSKEGELDETSKTVDGFMKDHLKDVTVVHRAKEMGVLKMGATEPTNTPAEGSTYTVNVDKTG